MAKNQLDDRDQKILSILEADSRTAISELARNISLSPTAVRQRIARLERDGVIEGYTIRTGAVEPQSTIKAVVMLTLTGAFCSKIKAAFGHMPEIRKFWSTTGELDATLIVQVPTIVRLQEVTEKFSAHDLVRRVQTHVIIATHIDR
ncbi:Lrp/AsnC family transcriptional regulator [Kiloniella laminariae]|uniref:Lrp/AsnC family transcriptional regulator n=1 Tax=Kiloniella laminariae TaxID=454162 RepID=A0ABT4LLI1_9PROT|nr:Lrp/AsnC family transcriptional regulator [Kiloniella laminariae]MCZ4281975.1 Lrp/AsnC family transcriptional regulator [Kiloniella laminariae]